MKKHLVLLSFALSSFLLHAQNYFEGKIVWNITYKLDESMKESEAYLPKEMTYTAKGKHIRLDMQMMGMPMSVIMKGDTKEYFTLMNVSGQKIAMKMSEKDLKLKSQDSSKYVVEKFSETKTVSGYLCKKAVVTDSDGTKSTVWYTDKLKMVYDPQYGGYDVGGFVVEVHTIKDGMDMTLVAKTITQTTISESAFEIPAGYQVVDKNGLGK